VWQVAETLRLIQGHSTLPIQRARMRVRVVLPAVEGERLQEQLRALAETVEKEDKGESWETVCISHRIVGRLWRGCLGYAYRALANPHDQRTITEGVQG